MEKAILLALAASFCTATASVCQRLGAETYEISAEHMPFQQHLCDNGGYG